MKENKVTKTVKFEGTTSEDPIFSGLGAELPFTLDSTTFATEPSKGDHTITFTWNSDNTVTASCTK